MNAASDSVSSSRPLQNYLWLVKRELWEHRAGLLITPLVVAVIILASVFYGLGKVDSDSFQMGGPGLHMTIDGHPAAFTVLNYGIFTVFSLPFLIVMFFVTAYYALDALYADRRDRSILFWKSLPLSDVETVVSKLIVATAVAPAIAFVISLATQFILMGVLSAVFAAKGHSVARLWAAVPVIPNFIVFLYSFVVLILWYAPVWAWCLLASAWARRAAFLWATIPIAAAGFLEFQTLGTSYVRDFLRTRLSGMVQVALHVDPHSVQNGPTPGQGILDLITPAAFFSSAQLWIGLALAALLIGAAVWVRRFREVA